MAKSSDIIKIGFDYRASLEQFIKETNGVFDGISEMAGKQKISIQLDAKNDKVIEKIKELQKLKLDKFTFEFGESGLKEQLKTFDQLEKKINEIINLSKGLSDVVFKTDFGTANKTEAYNQLKQMADVFKKFYGNEEVMHTKAGTDAAYAYYKAYEEALKKGVAQSKLERVTVDADPEGFWDASKLSSSRIKDFENFQKYGGELTDLSLEISNLEQRLLKFRDTYSKVKINLGDAPITPDILKNIEEYVRYLEIAENRIKDADLMGFSKNDIDDMNNLANMHLGFALEDATLENEKYISSLKEVREEKEKTDDVISHTTTATALDSIVNEESLNIVIDLFGKIESHLSEMKKVFADVGDGEEFSPLLKIINSIQDSIKSLNKSVSSIGLNMNIDIGSDKEIEARLEEKASKALIAYQRLFDHIKTSSAGGSFINNAFFDFDINQYDSVMSKVQAYRKFIDNMRKEAKDFYNGYDVLYQDTDKKYWASASASMAQVTKTFNEMKVANNTNPLENLFGKTDLTEVISQLDLIVTKLGEISSTVLEFKNAINISTSVEEIGKLTSKVKELEDELSKVKTSTSTLPIELNDSSPTKDTIQVDKIEQVTTSAKELDKIFEQAVDVSTDDFDEILSKLDLTKSKLGEIVKITKQGHAGEDGKFIESFVLKDKNGSSETYGNSSHTEKGQLLRYNYIEKNTDAINKQKNAEKELQSQRDAFNKKNLNAIDLEIKKREEESSAYAKTLKSQMEERYSAISSMEKSLDNYNSKLKKFSAKHADGHRYPMYQQQIDNLTKEISELDTLKNNLSKKDIIDESDMKSVNALQQEIDELILKMNNMSAGERGFDPLGADKALEKINSELKKNSAMSKESKRQIQGFYDEIKSGNPSKPIKDLLDDMYKIIQAEREAGREGKRFFDILSDKAIYGYAAQLAGYYLSFMDFIRYGRQVVDTVVEIDTALTELRKVSDATEQRLTENFKKSAETAKDLGATVSDVISATADWSRMGFDIVDAEELARVSTLYKNVGDGINVEEANNSLISTLQGFQLVTDEAESVVDKFNEVSNNFAITSGGIGEALQRSAASFNAANTDLSKSIALITATNEVVQNPEVVGTLWKTLSARIRGAKTELEELGEETDEYTETTSKLRNLIKGLTGFDIMEDENTFKDIYEIILGIGQEWDNLTDVEQASLGEALAGEIYCLKNMETYFYRTHLIARTA